MTDIIDVWMQQPTARFHGHEVFDSLRRSTRNTRRIFGLDERGAS